MFTLAFFFAALERAVKSAAQAALLAIGADQLNVLSLDWATTGGFAGGGFLLSLLTSYASGLVTSSPGPSLATEVVEPGRHAA